MMMLRKIRIAALFVVLLFLVGHGHGAVTIAQNGAAKAVIVIAEDAPEPEQHAAAELADFLQRITGATFEISHDSVAGKSCLFVGPKAARLADADFSTEELGADGIIIRTVGNDLILAGGYPRGTLYAVYTFLEDQLGCRWWSSKVSSIPKKTAIAIDTLNVRYVPPLEYRESFWYDAFDGDWAVRNKCNGNSERLDVKRGGKHRYEGFVHTFYPLIPPDKYFEDHPEWFSEIDGKRSHKRAQLCLTNEQMRAELVKNLKERLRKNPSATIASVSQNDWHGNCKCSQCAAIEAEEGSPAGLVLRFVNAVAEDIEQEFPNVAISTLAYQYTRKPPRITKPRHNVIVRLCSIECSFSVPLSRERNSKFRDDIVGWSKICNRLYIWDYTTNFRHHIMPHPNLRVLGPNVKFFVDHSVKGIFEQGAYTTNGAEMAELRAWVLAKLLWDPTRDGQELIDEFIAGYYGPAGPHIQDYLKITHDAVEAAGDKLGCFSPHTAKFLSFETLNKGWKRLKAAEAAVQGDPDLQFRIRVAQLPVMYAFMMRWNEMREACKTAGADWPMPESIEATYEQFKEVARKNNVTRLNEWQDGFVNLDKAIEQAKKYLSFITKETEPKEDPRVTWLKQHAISLKSIDPNDEDFTDLEPLKKILSDIRIVQLGEATHGDGATFHAKTRLVKFLHQKLGFDVLAFESGLYDCRKAWELLCGGMEPYKAFSTGVNSIWARSEQVRPLIDYWGRVAKGERPLEVCGFDCQFSVPQTTIDHLVKDVNVLWDKLATAAPDASQRTAIVETLAGLAKRQAKPSSQEREQRQEAMAVWCKALETARPSDALPEAELQFWRRVAVGYHWLAAIRGLRRDAPERRELRNLRDPQMARNLVWLARSVYPQRKIIVWAASTHLARTPLPSWEATTMSHELWKALGDETYTVAFTAAEGEWKWWNMKRTWPLPPPAVRSLEELFVRAGCTNAFVDFRGLEPHGVWLKQKLIARPFGYGNIEANWTEIFDGIVFTKKMFPSTKRDDD